MMSSLARQLIESVFGAQHAAVPTLLFYCIFIYSFFFPRPPPLTRIVATAFDVNARTEDTSASGRAPYSTVISAGYDRAVKIWDVRSNSVDPIQSISAWRDAVTSLTVAGHRVSGGSVDGSVRTVDVRAGRMHTDDLGEIGPSGPTLRLNSAVFSVAADETTALRVNVAVLSLHLRG